MSYEVGDKFVVEISEVVESGFGTFYRLKGNGMLKDGKWLDGLDRLDAEWAYHLGWANGRRDGMKEARCNTANSPVERRGTSEWMNIPEATDKPEKGDFRAELGLIMDTIDCIDKKVWALEKKVFEKK